ncbi:MAG TPA: tRNA (adenosine(37)-N6)-threonylcarbamoyltransferase complex dimerization subunit type 1 TsaB [Candidatus Margulisiibacteriota bacterium]|nr:tRNA (adenosine(37)-N6)-threonylcarbamoyltransferase complex dimerization subunit type 1 TsaB [Candidatus Margulisiibacteriota bacterium]
MRILGIDTSTRFLCIALYDSGKLYEFTLETGPKLSSLLGVSIKRVLDAAGLALSDIDYFACGVGPGSFTGMRIGIATMQGISSALKKPVVGISSLDLLAKNASREEGCIVPAIDAKRGLIYSAIYKNKNGALIRSSPYLLLTIEELAKKIKGKAVLLGDAAGLYRSKILSNIRGVKILDRDYWYFKPHNIIRLSLGTPHLKLKPVYLYAKECQIKQTKKFKDAK